MLVGVVSDSHGSLAPGAEKALAGVGRIIHAGDIGSQRILDELSAIAPVIAVRGNTDTGELEWRLNDVASVLLDGHRVMVTHRGEKTRAEGAPEGVEVFVSGHTHRASVESVGGVLYVNPGSIGGHNRDGRHPTLALLDLDSTPPTARIVEL